MLTPNASHTLLLAPAVPVKANTNTYTRFGQSFEPLEYSDWIDESMSWKTSCYIGDWSPLQKMLVKGPDALKFFSSIAVNSFTKFELGQAKHTVFCDSAGQVIGEGILMRLAEEDFLFTSGPGLLWAHYQFQKGAFEATAELQPNRFILQVSGPSALHVMEKVTGGSMRDIGFMRFAPRAIQGRGFLALRQGMAGEVGFELHGDLADGEAIYQAVLDAGAEFGIRRLGGRVKMVNHVEACFPTPTVDYMPAILSEETKDFFDNYVLPRASGFRNLMRHSGSYAGDDVSKLYRNPVELGWGRSIKFDHDFIGRAALEKELAAPRRLMRTLVWNSEDVVAVYAELFAKGDLPPYMELPRGLLGCMECDRVEVNGELVGASTSRCYSVYFREMISLCTIDVAWAEPGTEVVVVWGDQGGVQRRIRAKVAPAPYKTDNRKIDLNALPVLA